MYKYAIEIFYSEEDEGYIAVAEGSEKDQGRILNISVPREGYCFLTGESPVVVKA
jgi:hypothetical protein